MASMLTSEKESINLSTRNRREDVKRAEKSFDQGKHREGMGPPFRNQIKNKHRDCATHSTVLYCTDLFPGGTLYNFPICCVVVVVALCRVGGDRPDEATRGSAIIVSLSRSRSHSPSAERETRICLGGILM